MKTRAAIATAVAIAAFVSAASPALAADPANKPLPPPPPPPVEPAIKTPPVTDPMLTPPPESPSRIGSWDDALALIRAQSPDYLSSAQAVERASAQKRILLAAVLPVLTGQASYAHQFYTAAFTIAGTTIVSPPENVLAAGAGVTWNVVSPRDIYQVGTAAKNVEVSRLTFSDRRRLIAIDVVESMMATLAAARVAELNRVGLRSALERLQLTQARLQYGQGTALDVDRASQDVESARRLIISGDEALIQSREVLGAALGSPVAMAPPGDLDLDQFESAVMRTCRLNDAIERRPDVAAAREGVVVAERRVTEADLLFSPTVQASTQFQHTNVAVLGPLTTWSLGATLVVPFYDGGARYGIRRDAVAALEEARQNLVSVRLAAVVGSAQALRNVNVVRDARDVARRGRDLALQIDARTRDGYAHGIGTSLDLVTSAQDLRRAEIDLAILEYRYASARADAVLTNAECLY